MTQALDSLIDNLRKVDAVGVAVAEDALPQVVAANRATAGAGTDAYGAAWPKRKDGGAPLADVAGKITGVVSGAGKAVITLVVGGYWHKFHQTGLGKSLPKRSILPEADRGVPAKMAEILRASAAKVIGRTVRGGA